MKNGEPVLWSSVQYRSWFLPSVYLLPTTNISLASRSVNDSDILNKFLYNLSCRV